MGRKRIPRRRVGAKEKKQLHLLTANVRAFKVFWRDKSKGETRLNDYLINHLRQSGVMVENTAIPEARFFGERFRPECFVPGTGAYHLCCLECKKLTDKTLKIRWKEGLAQSLLYTQRYKYVLYVLYDYTKKRTAAQALGRGRKDETTFAKSLRQALNVEVIVLRAL